MLTRMTRCRRMLVLTFLCMMCVSINAEDAPVSIHGEDASADVFGDWSDVGNATGPVTFTFLPPSLEVNQDNDRKVYVNVTTTFSPPLLLEITCNAPDRADVVDGQLVLSADEVDELEERENDTLRTWYTSFTIRAKSLTRTTLDIDIQNATSVHLYTVEDAYDVVVLRRIDAAYDAFNYILVIFLLANGLGFGCEFDFTVAKAIVRKPIPLILGLVLQYVMMPLLALGLAYVTQLEDDLTFGLLTIGSCPGGGLSNIFTLFMGGDITLSMCLTLQSNIFSIGMMPLWMLTLGNLIIPNTIAIPYGNIVVSLILLLSPIAIGIIIKHFSPKAGLFLRKALRVCAALMMIFILTLGVYANLYALEFINDWKVAVCGMFLPWTGMLITAGVALLAKQPFPRVKTLAIETAIQNSTLALVLLRNTLDQPEADITSVMPISVVTFGPAPFIIYSFVRVVHIFIKSRGKQDDPELQIGDAVVDGHTGKGQNGGDADPGYDTQTVAMENGKHGEAGVSVTNGNLQNGIGHVVSGEDATSKERESPEINPVTHDDDDKSTEMTRF